VPGKIVSLPATAGGNLTPQSTIASSQNPNFGRNFLMSVDPNGKLWITSCQGFVGAAGPVLAFSPAANGSSVNPLINISGSATGLSGCQLGVIVDGSGNAFVADPSNVAAAFPGGQVAIFTRGQNGNVAPSHRISGTNANFHSPAGLALDSAGELYVADSGFNLSGFPGDVQVFASGASGNVASIRTIAGSNTGFAEPFGLAFDPFGNLYVTNVLGNSVEMFRANASGNVAPVRTIAGANTQLDQPSAIAIDAAGFIYVGTQSVAATASILVFAPGSNGNVAPIQSIVVNISRFSAPSGVAVQ
jgi:sugar lactone lactonase YvrE